MHQFHLIAHRGSPLRAPENTLASFLAAKKVGASHVETDVQLTADGIPVLCHDDVLTRYGHGSRSIGEMSYADLAKLDFGQWFDATYRGEPVLRLEELLAHFGSEFCYHIELKDTHPETAGKTLALLRQFRVSATITSFHYEQLQRARSLAPTHALGWLVKEVDQAILDQAKQAGFHQLCPEADQITETFLQQAADYDLQVRAWGCPKDKARAVPLVTYLQSTSCIGITVDELSWFHQAPSQ